MKVVVVGAGISGASAALELGRRGAEVTLLDRGLYAGEASRVAGGILGAQAESESHGSLADVLLAARARYPDWIASLETETGGRTGYQKCGVLRVATTESELDVLRSSVEWQREANLRVELGDRSQVRALEPALASSVVGGVFFPDDAQVDPIQLAHVIRAAMGRVGVRVEEGVDVRTLVTRADRCVGVRTADGDREADAVVVATGSWVRELLEQAGHAIDVRPIRGQVVHLRESAPSFGTVVYGLGAYRVPRGDGRVVVGATTEDVGYCRGVTAEGVGSLVVAAYALVPSLARATFVHADMGFRPRAAGDALSLAETLRPGLVVTAGHYRNGILLAPSTGVAVADAVLGRWVDRPRSASVG